VDGDSNQADITYENSSGDTSQETGAALPWTEAFTVEEGSFAYVSAQRGGAPGRAGDSAIDLPASRGPRPGRQLRPGAPEV
jgi:hypothetical protein